MQTVDMKPPAKPAAICLNDATYIRKKNTEYALNVCPAAYSSKH